MSHRTVRTASLAVLAGLTIAASFTGCKPKTRHAGDVGAIIANPSPALDTRSKRGSEQATNYSLVSDTQGRMIAEDISRALLIDRPTRLAPGPVPR